jgi:predicted GNAT family N-acyltransferase
MAVSTRSEFIDFILPLRERLHKYYDKNQSPLNQPQNDAADPARAVPQGFIDAMIVREAVFVKEQVRSLQDEFDEDDPRSFHWTVYASIPAKANMNPTSPTMRAQDGSKDASRRTSNSTSTKIPIGAIRVTPKSFDELQHGKLKTDVPQDNEAFAQIGRLAVIKEFRKAGISKLLVDTALKMIREHPYDLVPKYDSSIRVQVEDPSEDFNGLLLVHSPVEMQKVWRKYGFVTDEAMGTWNEDDIEHCGMWKRVDVTDGRRKSKVKLPGRPS